MSAKTRYLNFTELELCKRNYSITHESIKWAPLLFSAA